MRCKRRKSNASLLVHPPCHSRSAHGSARCSPLVSERSKLAVIVLAVVAHLRHHAPVILGVLLQIAICAYIILRLMLEHQLLIARRRHRPDADCALCG